MSDYNQLKAFMVYIRKNKTLRIVLFLTLLSYFYNLKVMGYSLTGQNELRLYDFTGLFLLYYLIKYRTYFMLYIKAKPYLYRLFLFIFWALITMIFTFIFSIYINKIIWILRTILFMYHLFVFSTAYLFFLVFLREKKFYKQIVTFFIGLVIFENAIVLLQNFGFIDFLWGAVDRRDYLGFLSGTLGPNKIVLGLTMFLSIAALLALSLEKRIKINRTLAFVAISLSVVNLLISGSRTSYLALGILLAIVLLFKPGKMLVSIGVSLVLLFGITFFVPEIRNKIVEVYQYRIESRISNKEQLRDSNVSELYEDLGAGRKELQTRFLMSLKDNLYVVPFGAGFNNRMLFPGNSPHNMYLTLINEVGLVGLFFYVAWLLSYLFINFKTYKTLGVFLKAVVLSMMVTLLFGEHLYIFRPVFALLGLFLFVVALLISPRYFKYGF